MYRSSSRQLLAMVVLATAVACSSSGGSADPYEFQVDVEDGIPVATTVGGPRYEEPIFKYQEELVLKQDPGNPESLLSGSGTISMGDDGCFYVIDRRASRVAVFDGEGNYLRSFGARGSGPGEFFYGMSLLDHRDGVLIVWDPNFRRVTTFRENGELIESRFSSQEQSHDAGMLPIPQGGWVMLSGSGFRPVGGYSYQWRRAVVTDAKGDTLTDIRTEPVKFDFVIQYPGTTDHPGGVGGRIMEFVGVGVMRYLPDEGILVSTNGWNPEIVHRDLNGNLCRVIRVEMEREPVTPEIQARIRRIHEDEYASRAAEEWRSDPATRAEMEAQKFLERKAFWSGMEIDDMGWYWLLIPELGPDIREQGGLAYRVLTPEGEYLGNSRRPYGSSNTIRKGRCLNLSLNEDTGEPQATIYRITSAVEGVVYP